MIKCLALCLITIIVARFRFLHLYACLTCSSVHALTLHPLLEYYHLCYVDCYCVFFFWLYFFFSVMWYFCCSVCVELTKAMVAYTVFVHVICNLGILYLWLYYRPVDRELSRNFLVDPSRRQVGHPWNRLLSYTAHRYATQHNKQSGIPAI